MLYIYNILYYIIIILKYNIIINNLIKRELFLYLLDALFSLLIDVHNFKIAK